MTERAANDSACNACHCRYHALGYLVVLGQVDLLPTLFGQVIIPLAVVGELQHSKAPAAVRAWIASPPPWLDMRPSSLLPDAVLLRLDPGEREALLLAQELRADLVLVDDQMPVQSDKTRVDRDGHVHVFELAASVVLWSSPRYHAIARCRLYMTPKMIQELLARDAARKRPS